MMFGFPTVYSPTSTLARYMCRSPVDGSAGEYVDLAE